MARPRTPAKILELRGAFRKDPSREREDAEGAGEFEREPPSHLPQSVAKAWAYLVARLPRIALTSSDEIAVEQAARCLAAIWGMGEAYVAYETFKKFDDSLRQWLIQLGMSPVARTKVAGTGAAKRRGNPFEALKGAEKSGD